MKTINNLYKVLTTLALSFLLIGLSNAGPGDIDLFPSGNSNDNSGDNSFYKEDGSLVIIRGAKDSGLIVRGTDSGTEQEYYVIPKDDGSKTFIYDEGLTICDSTGCY